jgi:hypothetical protein
MFHHCAGLSSFTLLSLPVLSLWSRNFVFCWWWNKCPLDAGHTSIYRTLWSSCVCVSSPLPHSIQGEDGGDKFLRGIGITKQKTTTDIFTSVETFSAWILASGLITRVSQNYHQCGCYNSIQNPQVHNFSAQSPLFLTHLAFKGKNVFDDVVSYVPPPSSGRGRWRKDGLLQWLWRGYRNDSPTGQGQGCVVDVVGP